MTCVSTVSAETHRRWCSRFHADSQTNTRRLRSSTEQCPVQVWALTVCALPLIATRLCSIIQALIHLSVCLCCLPPSHPWHASFTLSLQNRIYEHLSQGYVQRAHFPKQTNSSFPPPWAQIIRENVAHPVPAIILAPYSVCLCARHVVYTPDNIWKIMDITGLYGQNTAYITAVMSRNV